MDTSDPEITFNENGVCNYCLNYEEKKLLNTPKEEDKPKLLDAMVDYCKKEVKVKSTTVLLE